MRLIIFDVDGTLVDSQAQILQAMKFAFDAVDQPVPSRSDILSIVGLSLPEAFAVLLPQASKAEQQCASDAYKDSFNKNRRDGAKPQFYDGIYDVLETLRHQDETLLGVATGKSRRGLMSLCDSYGITPWFQTMQVADDHPSKPNPSMILQAMTETGIAPHQTVMIGDTSYDMQMARSANVAAIGVTWGFHARDKLVDAHVLCDKPSDLLYTIDQQMEPTHG